MPRDPGADSAAYTRYGARFEAACLGHCLMAGAGLKSIAAAAAAFVLLGIGTPAGSRAADRFNSIADVIPAPAQAQPGRGIFALRTGTRVSIPRDPRAEQIGRYFAALLLQTDRKSTRLNSSHSQISYAVFCLKKKHLAPVKGRQ